MGSARVPGTLNGALARRGPTPRMTTCLAVVPVITKPAVSTSAPVPTRASVETLANRGSWADSRAASAKTSETISAPKAGARRGRGIFIRMKLEEAARVGVAGRRREPPEGSRGKLGRAGEVVAEKTGHKDGGYYGTAT